MKTISKYNRSRIPWPIAIFVFAMPLQATFAAEAESAVSALPTTSDSDREADTDRRQLDLGSFQIQQVRPTRNVTIDAKFELTLVLPETATKAVKDRLEKWKHRLRDKVITAVRLAETNDFSEPELRRLQRLILLRLNRAIKFTRVEGLFITRFEFANQ